MAEVKRVLDALVRSRRGGLAASAALGGLALIAGLAVRATQRGEPEAGPVRGATRGTAQGTAAMPFDAGALSDDEATLCLRIMVAASAADGVIDARERERLDAAVAESGLDLAGRQWLARELEDPATIDEIADRVANPEAGARVYAAARLAIDPDTMQERTFLRMLAEALDLDDDAVARVESGLAA
ncbi:tellurite resistance TerB family protein [Methylobacterium indicum]|uniref:Protein YebE n=1 Tax=Methylobacterium indicum TaxID=1775910 RepID=A0A0J6QSU9_9HYPH|nr:DUF533 domain-containing protein [Methylobacterium indicum]KMO12192.1 hypothetical protein QR78_27585 [Methylobacterium indicum]KMO13690.1 hypothetical protein QR79_26730 [Methylobacterium indicum]BCM83226.1 hypothetical protein mvi_16870 [Methylobacterium indicum]